MHFCVNLLSAEGASNSIKQCDDCFLFQHYRSYRCDPSRICTPGYTVLLKIFSTVLTPTLPKWPGPAAGCTDIIWIHFVHAIPLIIRQSFL
ncbi:hypothetical protein FKM82_023700 [Ascaphus truei]